MSPKLFVETSALAKLYVRERGSERVLELADSAAPMSMVVLSLSRVEMRSALRRREREGLAKGLVEGILARFQVHWSSFFLVHPASDPVISRALDVIDQHGLRAYDAMQLAGCLASRESDPACDTFVCADQQLLAAASAEGFATINPEEEA